MRETSTIRWIIVAGCLLLATAASAAAKPLTFDGADWIWHRGAENKAGTWYFQKAFDFPAGQKPKSAQLLITCDNRWTLYINGNRIGQNDPAPNSWQRPRLIDVTKHLVIERNAVAVECVNTLPGPAGFIMKLNVTFEDGKTFALTSDKTWISTGKPEKTWKDNGFVPGTNWTAVTVIGKFGIGPWGLVTQSTRRTQRSAAKLLPLVTDEKELRDPAYQHGVVFVGSSVGLNVSRQPIYYQPVRGTRAYFEMDPMTPAALGHTLWSLVPLRHDGTRTLLCDAGNGVLGSPTVSYDGKTVYFSMASEGEAYFHVYRVNAEGGAITQVTRGPFHDYDPVELPDGRIAFSSTRLGSREEYHAKYASCIFTCNVEGKDIKPLTHHIVADREPRVMADGSLVFIRSDNFLERAKVEVHLHQTRLDGTGGEVIIGPGRKGIRLDRDVGAEHNMSWLRKFGVGSPAPLPDGRVAAISQKGLVSSEAATGWPIGRGFVPFDMSPLTDGRLVCTSKGGTQIVVFDPAENTTRAMFATNRIHSVVSLGARERPVVRPSTVRDSKTGYLYCQNALNTQQIAADTRRIKAVRVYMGQPFTLEPTKSIYEHIGTVGVELGTVPLAADGSFYAEVPADRPLAIQAVDGEGRAVINELSWIYTRPGEQRGCVGCHAAPSAAPRMRNLEAMQGKPIRLVGTGDPHRFRANNGANGGVVNMQLDKLREIAAINLHDVPPNDDSLSTIQRLGTLRDRSAVPRLVRALKAPTAEIRVAAALSLSSCGNRDAAAPLMKALKDKDPTVVRAAASALDHLTGRPKGGTDWQIIETELVTKLNSQDQQTVHMAIEALGHVGSNPGKQAIRDYLQKNPAGELRILMAAIRSLGYLQDHAAIPLLAAIMNSNLNKRGKGGWGEGGFNQKPTYLAATAAEALGRIGGAAAEKAILEAFGKLGNFESHVMFTGEHGWLRSAQASPIYFRMLEALERMNSKGTGPYAAKIVESLQSDKDRGLLYELDTYEGLVSRAITRGGRMEACVEACFNSLGEPSPPSSGPIDPALPAAVSKPPHNEKHIRKHTSQSRSAQVLSIVCTDVKYAPRIRKTLLQYRAQPPSETRSWVCFMLTRALGRLGDTDSIPLFSEMLEKDPTEASLGLNPPPAHIIYKGWRPFYRPAAAWALGELKATKAVPALLKVVQDLDNASSTREQAAIALGKIGSKSELPEIERIARNYPELTTRRALLEAADQISSSPP